MTTEAQRAAMRRYYNRTKKERRVLVFRLNRNDDADVIALFDAADSKTDLLRKLARGE